MFQVSLRLTVSALSLSVILSGCATSVGHQKVGKDDVAVVPSAQPANMDPIAAAAFWGTRFDRSPQDAEVAIQFSKALRKIGKPEESLRVVKTASLRSENNPELYLEMGKSLIANDRAHEAVRQIEMALANGKANDWSAFSAYGVALDKIGQHRKAREQYDLALQLAPGRAEILNNKGLSFALNGRKKMAEATLRSATTAPGGTARIRQNLALVLAMSGDKAEAERLARSDLPPAVADNNVAYYQQLVSQPSYWQDLTAGDTVQPDFGDDPSTFSTAPRSEPIPEPGTPVLRQAPFRRPADRVKPTNQEEQIVVRPDVSASVAQSGPQAIASNAPLKLSFENKPAGKKD